MFHWLFYFAIFIGFVPVVILLFKKNGNSHETFIVPFLWLVFIATLYEYINNHYWHIDTRIWFRLYLLLEFYTLAYYFYQLLKRKYKWFFSFFSGMFMITFVYLIYIWDPKESVKTDSYLSVIEITFVFCAVFLWFKQLFIDLSETSLLNSANFYFVSGLIIYFSGTFVLFIISDVLQKTQGSDFIEYWDLNIIFNIILRLCLIIGVWKIVRKSNRSIVILQH